MESKKSEPVLIGDVGGTNIRLQIITVNKETKEIIKEKGETLKTSDYKSFKESIEHFLKDAAPSIIPKRANIGIAGPVFNNEVKISNVKHWQVINGDILGKELGIVPFKLFNDFEIASYAVLGLQQEDQIQINQAVRVPNQIISVCGAGTGFGVSMIVPEINDDGTLRKYTVWPGEGGHSAFPSLHSTHFQYYQYVLSHFQGQQEVALQYCFVGPAIPYIYTFLAKQHPQVERKIEKEIGAEKFALSNKDHYPSANIFKSGAEGSCPFSRLVVDFFWEIYQTVLGDIGLRTLSYSGIYLIGNIGSAICDYVLTKKKDFLREYKDGRQYLSATFERIPVYIIKKQLGLDGAGVITRQQLGL